MTRLAEFLFPAPAHRTPGAILRWWEARRLPYNVVVGAAGLLTLGVVRVLTWLPPDAHAGGMPPWPFVVVYGVLANVCYCLGPALEIGLHWTWGRRVIPVGPALYRMGLTFSLGLTLLPVLLVGLEWLFRVVRVLL